MSNRHRLFHYAITCHTDDEGVLHCLRALAQYCEQAAAPHIAWGGTGREAWRKDHNAVTFRFTKPVYREQFAKEAHRLLPDGWSVTGESDNDPASPQRPK